MATVHTCLVDDIAVETVSGDLDLAASRAVLAEAFAEAADRVLIDCRTSRKTLSFGDVLRLVAELRRAPELRAKRVALVSSPFSRAELTQLAAARFQEEGFAVRDFYDFDEAMTWLEADGPA